MTDAPGPVARLLDVVRGLFAAGGGSRRDRLGRRGENAAARLLKADGYRILTRNWTITQGEVDLVAFRDGVLAFVEVRSQTQPAPFDPALTVTRAKQRRVIKAAQAYMTENAAALAGVRPRLDVITVLFDEGGRLSKTTHIEDAFQVTNGGFT